MARSETKLQLRMGAADWNMMGLLWACSFLFFEVLRAAWPPLTIVLGRVASRFGVRSVYSPGRLAPSSWLGSAIVVIGLACFHGAS